MSALTVLISPPLSHDWCMVRIALPSLSFGRCGYLFKLIPEPCIVSTQNCCHIDLWSAWLVFTHHHHFHRHQLPLHKIPTRNSVSWLFLVRLSLAYLSVRFLGRQEMFSNSHLSVLRECSPWVSFRSHGWVSRLAVTRIIWSEWTWAW
jgi:hypothetical protein